MGFYVFRIDYGACYDLIKKELQEQLLEALLRSDLDDYDEDEDDDWDW